MSEMDTNLLKQENSLHFENIKSNIKIEVQTPGKYARVLNIDDMFGETDFVLGFDKTGDKLRLFNTSNKEQVTVDVDNTEPLDISFDISSESAELTVNNKTQNINWSSPIELKEFNIHEFPIGEYMLEQS